MISSGDPASLGSILRSWNADPLVALPLIAATVAYLLGVREVRHRRGPSSWRQSRTLSFLVGIGLLAVALLSPVDAYSGWLLSVHMVQHTLLMLVAPPLLLLGRPLTLALAASRGRQRAELAAVARSRVTHLLGSPVVGFAGFALVLWVSHLSPIYELSIVHRWVHALEHAAYLTAALAWWWPVVGRDPGASRLSYPGRLLYVFLTMPVMSLLGFVLTSSKHVLYLHYVATSHLLGHPPLSDQQLAGTLMWVGSMLIGAITLSAVLLEWMEREEAEAHRIDVRNDRLRTLSLRAPSAEMTEP